MIDAGIKLAIKASTAIAKLFVKKDKDEGKDTPKSPHPPHPPHPPK